MTLSARSPALNCFRVNQEPSTRRLSAWNGAASLQDLLGLNPNSNSDALASIHAPTSYNTPRMIETTKIFDRLKVGVGRLTFHAPWSGAFADAGRYRCQRVERNRVRVARTHLPAVQALRYVVEQTFTLLHQLCRLAVRWERHLDIHGSLSASAAPLPAAARLINLDRTTILLRAAT